MKEFKGTKGEWKVKSKMSGLETEIFCGKIRVAQAKHFNNGEKGYENAFKNDPLEKEGKANAKLIAAAPGLLKALQKLIYFNERTFTGMGQDYTKMISKAEEAINKALN